MTDGVRALFHSAYGLRIRANVAIPGLPSLPEVFGADLAIELGSIPIGLDESHTSSRAWCERRERDGGAPILRVWTMDKGRYFRFLYADGTEFVIDREGTRIWARWPEPLTLEDTAVYLLGPVLGFVLLLRGTTCLHASSVAVGEGALALVGPAGAGKSTTAAALAGQGHPVVSEDVVTLGEHGGGFHVQPGYPCIRLWPSSVRALYGSADALPLMTPNWEKRGLDLIGNGHRFQPRPLPLRAIYVLGERTTDPSAPYVEALPPQDGLIALVANTYANYLKDKDMRSQEFRLLARVVAGLPVRKIVPHADVARLSALCDLILNNYRDLTKGEDCGVTPSLRSSHV